MPLKRRLRILDYDTDDKAMEQAALKVAFATTDFDHVNQHFGSTKSFVIYAVDPEQCKMLEVAQFGELAQDGNENKLIDKFSLLEGCVAVYAQAVGASAMRQLKALGIQPVKVSGGAVIADLLESMQDELRSGPGTWLARAIQTQKLTNPNRFDDMEAEGWDE